MPIVRFDGVAKSLQHGFWLRHKPVLHDVSLRVERGEIYGFLGPNGAGKTTSMKCLLGLLTPDRGTIEIFGRNGSEPAARQKRRPWVFASAPVFGFVCRKSAEFFFGLIMVQPNSTLNEKPPYP